MAEEEFLEELVRKFEEMAAGRDGVFLVGPRDREHPEELFWTFVSLDRKGEEANPAGGPVIEAVPEQKPPVVESAYIQEVPFDKQDWQLSCEASAAGMAARHFGVEVSEAKLLELFGRSENPFLGFRGAEVNAPPGGLENYGVYAGPVVAALEKAGIKAEVVYGLDMAGLKQHIKDGHPVIAWITYDCWEQTPVEIEIGGEMAKLVPFEHTVLVVGYDAKGVFVHDPYDGTRKHYSWPVFEDSFRILGNMAVVIKARL